MNLQKDLLEHISSRINNINIDELFENVKLNSLINRQLLIDLCEGIYYRDLILNKEQNCKLLSFLELLKSDTANEISELTYLYMIYTCDREIKKSKNNIYT